MKNTFSVEILKIQPSQLFINKKKIKKNRDFLVKNNFNYDPFPVIKIDDKLVLTDGHTRLYLLFLNHIQNVNVYFDEDEIDLNAYKTCVLWCIDEKIFSIKDLTNRLLSNTEYQKLWIEKCSQCSH